MTYSKSHPADCTAVAAAMERYISGDLSESEAINLEAHASACSACEVLLERVGTISGTYAPTPPPELRTETLSRIRQAVLNQTASANRPWSFRRIAAPLSALAAAALLGVVLWPRASGQPVDAVSASAPESVVADPASGLVAVAERIAILSAQPELAALDAASVELTAALAETPDDGELLTYLASVRARRDELQRRVAEVAL